MTVKQKILIFSLVTLLVPFSILGYFSYTHSIRINQARFVQELQYLGILVASDLKRRVERIVADVEAFAAAPLVQQAAIDEEAASLDIEAYFASLNNRFPNYRHFRIVRSSGSHATQEGSAQLVLGQGESGVQVTVALGKHPGTRVLVADADLQLLQQSLEFTADKRLYLVAGGKRLLNASGMPQPPPPISTGEQRPVTDFDNAYFYPDPNGVPVLGLLIPTRVEGLEVLVEIEADRVFSALAELRARFLSIRAAVLVILMVGAHFFSRSLVRPVRDLIEGVCRVSSGDLDVDLPSDRKDEIGSLSRVFNEMVERLQVSRRIVSVTQAQLQEQNRRLEALTTTDTLTGLANRRSLSEHLSNHLDRFQRNRRPFCVMMLDIDHFKTINDRYGHLVGDEVLRQFARCLSKSIRSVDFVARYGGEEFTVILSETGRSSAMESAERIRAEVETIRVEVADETPITVSIGMAEASEADIQPEILLQRADAALYQAKQTGRNCVCFAAANANQNNLSIGHG